MNLISSKDIDKCLKYSYLDAISVSEYASFLRFLIKTVKKELPVEILNKANNVIVKGKVADFTIEYYDGREGKNDNLIINILKNDEELETFSLSDIERESVSKDSDSGPRTFYRFFIYPESNEDGYRFTFNRRITKK